MKQIWIWFEIKGRIIVILFPIGFNQTIIRVLNYNFIKFINYWPTVSAYCPTYDCSYGPLSTDCLRSFCRNWENRRNSVCYCGTVAGVRRVPVRSWNRCHTTGTRTEWTSNGCSGGSTASAWSWSRMYTNCIQIFALHSVSYETDSYESAKTSCI